MAFLSIVVPVYNVKDYLTRCIDSLVCDCASEDCEVIVVDDGSTDGSGDLADHLAEKYEIVRVLHKPNGGLSDARNYGVAQAAGEYVFYIDSDDYIDKGGLAALMKVARQDNSDVVIGNFYYQYSDHADLFDKEAPQHQIVKGGEEALSMLIEGKHYQNFAWGKLLRRELAQKYLFPKGRLFEDTYWFHLILHEANHVSLVSTPVVRYVQRDGSISFSYKLKSLDILDGYVNRLEFFKEKYPALVDKQKVLMADNCISHAWMMIRYLGDEDQKKGVEKLRSIINDNGLADCPLLENSKRRKLKMILSNMLFFKISESIEKIKQRFL